MSKNALIFVDQLKGVGPKRKALLNEAGIFTLLDLVYCFPKRYDHFISDSSGLDWQDGLIVEAFGTITQVQQYRPRRSNHIIKVTAQSGSKIVSLFWFNQPFLRNRFQIGAELHFKGKISQKGSLWNISHPKILNIEKSESDSSEGLLPVYSLGQKLESHWFGGLIRQALENYEWDDILPSEFLKEKKLLDRHYALNQIHTPANNEILNEAKFRLGYEELLLLQTALLERRYVRERVATTGIRHTATIPNGKVACIFSSLPYELTKGQKQSWDEIQKDMENIRPMQRLLQGEVGSGKTIIAALSLVKTVDNGFQGALMAPTEILAFQHFETLFSIFKDTEITIEFLSQSVSAKKRTELLKKLKNGTIDILIGTHAIIQDTVVFSSLGLVVVDEQHRFGVNQRTSLHSKGKLPDMLVMTATPIPRTLALTLYGDLDISSINTLPVNRRAIRTFVRSDDRREKVYQFAYDQIKKGQQVYVVVPAIEENDDFPLKSTENIFQEIVEFGPKDICCEVLHGKLASKDKKDIMDRFYSGHIDLLIATTVVEVGVHVPNATIMIVENAERFGLSQLHQLRGRVGRGHIDSYCILLSESQDNERLLAMEKISNGFDLAEEDLKIRGPGEFFGEKQHGLPELKFTELLSDSRLLKETRQIAEKILNAPDQWGNFFLELNQRFDHWKQQNTQH